MLSIKQIDAKIAKLQARKQKMLKRGEPNILVYQMGKVGSSTFYRNLKDDFSRVSYTHDHAEARNFLEKNSKGKTIILCGTREPLARCISAFFENIENVTSKEWYFGPREKIKSATLGEIISHFHERCEVELSNVVDPWFKRFAQNTGLNLKNLTFNQRQGFSYFEIGNLSIHLYRLESIEDFVFDLTKSRVFGDAKFPAKNLGKKKWSVSLQHEFKTRYRISQHEYDTRFGQIDWLSIFYGPQDISRLTAPYITS